MKIQIWYCEIMKHWRWTVTDSNRPIIRQESGQRQDLHDAMTDVNNTVNYFLEK